MRTHTSGDIGPHGYPPHPPPPHHFRGSGAALPFRGRARFFRGRFGGAGYFHHPGRGFRGGFWRGPGGGGPIYGRKVSGEFEKFSAAGGGGEEEEEQQRHPAGRTWEAEEGEEEPPDAVYAVSGDQVRD